MSLAHLKTLRVIRKLDWSFWTFIKPPSPGSSHQNHHQAELQSWEHSLQNLQQTLNATPHRTPENTPQTINRERVREVDWQRGLICVNQLNLFLVTPDSALSLLLWVYVSRPHSDCSQSLGPSEVLTSITALWVSSCAESSQAELLLIWYTRWRWGALHLHHHHILQTCFVSWMNEAELRNAEGQDPSETLNLLQVRRPSWSSPGSQ